MSAKKLHLRTAAVFVMIALVFAGFLATILIDRASGAQKEENAAAAGYDVAVHANRGEILDRNGNTFVYNEQINTLIIDAIRFPSDNASANAILLKMIERLESVGEEWIDRLPFDFAEDGTVSYTKGREIDQRWTRSKGYLYLNDYATAQNCYDALLEKYELTEMPADAARKVASVRWNMARMDFNRSNPYTFAEGISVQTIAYLKENGDFFRGVDAAVTTSRKYIGDGRTASHLLGVVSSISAEEYEAQSAETAKLLETVKNDPDETLRIRAQAYLPSDKIGQSGLELAMEKWLRGSNGVKTVTPEENGAVSETYKVRPRTGGTVITTLDLDMQQIAEKSLKSRILAVTDYEAIAGGMTPAGAVVVENVKTGEVLASASYPDYPLATYHEDYAELAADPGKPLWNRAFQSGYSPGSTMKPATAIAGLEEGYITPDSYFYCSGVHQYIDQTFVCFARTAHGSENVKTALGESCNLFFFDIAEHVGIQKLNAYSSLLGLGQKTGVEIAETEGILAGYEYRDARGLGWKAGETLLAAIGQSDNSFSVLQLTNYCATIANGGTRYVPYLVSKVLSADYSQVYYERSPQVAVQTNISETTLNAVKDGMYLVANVTSCREQLGHLQYKVACKTGTAEKTRIVNGVTYEGTDGFLIAFGPFDDPQIAITVAIENAGSGASTAQVAADIFSYYFSTLNTVRGVQPQNELL